MKKLNIACPVAIKDPDLFKDIRSKMQSMGHTLTVQVDPYDIFKMEKTGFDMILIEPVSNELKWIDVLIGVQKEFPKIPVILFSVNFPNKGLRRFIKNQNIYFSGDMDKILEQLDALINKKNKKSILFVDDDAALLKLYTRMLKQTPWELYTTESGEGALEILKDTKIDLVFTDIKMPNMHGIELISKIQSMYRDIPIVACSAYPKLKDDEDLKFQKIEAFLEKPIDLDTLTRTIKDALK